MEIAATPVEVTAVRARSPRIVRDSALNLIGLGVPLVVALFAIPPVVRGLGTDRFGILTLAWLVIGYFSLFDLGLGRALTQVVAARLGETGGERAPDLVWPALGIMTALGIVGGAVMSAFSPWLVGSVLKIPASLHAETLTTFYMLAAAIPVVVVTTGLIGILTAFGRFALLNALRIPLGVFTYVGPLLVLPFSHSLVSVTAVLIAARVLAAAAHFVACSPFMPSTSVSRLWDVSQVGPLFRFGAWMTVSNIISPLLVYVDRFLVGAVVSVSAVAYYATPFEMVTRLLIIPSAVISVLFPAFASSHRSDPALLHRLLARGAMYVGVAVFPVVLVTIALAPEGLRWWLGPDFATHSAMVLQVIALGVFINALAQVTFTLLQGVGRPDLTAKFHVLELPLYAAALAWAVRTHGIVGAAWVWTARVTFDALLLFGASMRYLQNGGALAVRALCVLSACAGCLVAAMSLGSVRTRAAFAMIVLGLAAVTVWRFLLSAEERARVRQLTSFARSS